VENDLIVSVVRSLDWATLRSYVVSLQRSGFTGTKLFFVENVSEEVRQGLASCGFDVINFISAQACRGTCFCTDRFGPVADFLNREYKNYRYVIWCDCRDLIFQSDPTVWLEKHLSPSRLVGATECLKIKDQCTNDEWIKRSVSSAAHARIREHDVLCSGTIAGDAEAMCDLFYTFWEKHLTQPSPEIHDQGFVNYLLWDSPFRRITRIPKMEEGFTVTASWFLWPNQSAAIGMFKNVWTDSPPVFDKQTGLVLTPKSGIPFSIVHQYDRDPEWYRLTMEKYK
jgi:hypothetical protein